MANKKTVMAVALLAIAVIIGIALLLFPQLPPVAPTTPTTPAETTAPPAPKEKVITIGTTDQVKHLDPALAYDFMSCNVIYNVYDTLVRYKPGTTEIEPWLAERWEVSENGTVWTFYLRKGVKFHDGTELTADAVVFSIKRVMETKGDPSWLVTEIVKDVKAVDKYTVRFYLKEPFTPFLSMLSFTVYAPVSPKAVKEHATDSDPWAVEWLDKHAVGTGPFKVVEWKEGEYIVLEKFDEYWNKEAAAKADKVVVRFFKDPTTMMLALEKGEIDIAFRHLSVEQLEELKKNPDIVVEEAPSLMIRYLVFNLGNFTELRDVKVRQAIAYAIDRDKIVNEVFKGAAVKIYSLVPPGLSEYYEPVFKKYDLPRDEALAKAKELLKEAGYSEEHPLELTLWYTTDHYGPKEADVAYAIKESLEETGMIKVELRGLPWTQFLDQLDHHVMMCFLLGWYPDYIDPDDYLFPFLHSSSSGPVFSSFYHNPKVDQLLEEARRTADVQKRIEIYKEVQKILGEDVPYIPLWSEKQYIAYRKGVTGVSLEPTMILWFWPLDKG